MLSFSQDFLCMTLNIYFYDNNYCTSLLRGFGIVRHFCRTTQLCTTYVLWRDAQLCSLQLLNKIQVYVHCTVCAYCTVLYSRKTVFCLLLEYCCPGHLALFLVVTIVFFSKDEKVYFSPRYERKETFSKDIFSCFRCFKPTCIEIDMQPVTIFA